MKAFRCYKNKISMLRIITNEGERDEPINGWTLVMDLIRGGMYYRHEDGRVIEATEYKPVRDFPSLSESDEDLLRQWVTSRRILSSLASYRDEGCRAYGWYKLIWLWTAPRLESCLHDYVYDRLGPDAYWRRINRARSRVERTFNVKLPSLSE